MNSHRSNNESVLPDEEHILDIIAEATISRLNSNSASYLFHSAGKDSNTIALVLKKV